MYVAGIDLGGTFIKTGLINGDRELVCKSSIPTGAGRDMQEIIRDMALSVENLAKENSIRLDEISGLGVGIPGVSGDRGVIVHNLYWFDVPLREELQKHLSINIFVDNDATAAALYEYHLGVLAGSRVCVLMTLGTGVGGGIIIGGKPFSGAHGLGSEIGHMAIVPNGLQCTCGNKGCLEAYASVPALVREGRRCVIERPESMLHHLADGDYNNVTAEMILDCAKKGDYLSLSILDKYVEYLAMGICTIENIIDPDVIAIGGGLSGAGDFLLSKIIRASEGRGIFENRKYADIKLAKAGNDAGLIGAAMLVMS